ncbi:MAG: sulfotransferase family protein, partial [Acidimicrobiia bacterium]
MDGRTKAYPPDFLILGAQKCGTTSLASALRTHPQVYMPPREGHHFSRVGAQGAGGRRYQRLFKGWSGQPVVGVKFPEYLAVPQSAEVICRALPDVKGIVVLRNPVDRAYSAYWHAHRLGRVSKDFETSCEKEFRRVADTDLRYAWVNLIQRGRYAEQLEWYRTCGFDPDRMLVVFFEEMIVEGATTLATVQEFLRLETSVTRLPRTNVARERNLPKPIRTALAIAGVSRFRSIRRRLARFERPFTPPPMEPEVRARLVEYYRPHNARLAELLGRDLPDWDR